MWFLMRTIPFCNHVEDVGRGLVFTPPFFIELSLVPKGRLRTLLTSEDL
jgi:hypothetical protein